MQQFSNQEIAELKSRIDQIHDLLASRGDEAEAGFTGPANGNDAPRSALLNQVSFTIHVRRIRRSHFGTSELSGPIWDMMLDLVLADTHGRALSASDLATGAGVPLSSGLRMIAALERLGLAQRSIDASDRRRSIVRLTDSGSDRMTSYFDKVGSAWQTNRAAAA
ncbi:MAG: winged helix DNA-binding protein [Sphingopyxis sp.]|uniref:MarR family winged helix-turn-helix transcriptional regulator n=1 Tax=Sphingopyxis sp. TaxID=1908224 RepID=UPI003D80DB11